MTQTTILTEQLKSIDACEDALIWSEGKTLEQAWEECQRGDWMLWLYRRAKNYDFQTLTLAKGHCANTVRHLMKDKRSTDAVDMAIKFSEGNATCDELNAAADASYAAADAAYAAYAADASYAAADAAYAAYAAAYAADAAYADADAAAATAAAAYAADATSNARKANQLATADICRKYLPIPIL